jgi:hypothetical protein
MKILKTLFIPTIALGCLTFLSSCESSGTSDTKNRTERLSSTDAKASEILDHYLEIKDALVQTDSEAASKAAKKLMNGIGSEQTDLMKNILLNAKLIAQTKDVKNQRDHFNSLSENVYKWVKETNVNDQKLYKQYCPMAFNNEGAYWLSAEKEVNNPYFGDKMLHCGSVKEEL